MAAPARPLSRFWEWGRSIVCVGRNYAEHAREMGETPPCRPLLFLKPASAYVRPGSPVQRPYYCQRLHPEPELAVVLGRRTRAVSRDDAMRYVAGYALCLDMTARDAQDTCKARGLPWTLAKSFDTSCPVSDFVPKERVADPHRLRLWLKVNGQLRQEGDTADMLFSVPELISYISEIITLHEGDVILTGTPPGVAAVEEHDELEAGIHGLVSMRFTVVQQRLGA
ncbi:acylpyruvase FAHD1, mitochondrial [Alligator mississippiensis]|uniref:Oxaloacetate tautomerase FAHD1, mitochondrial n=1 Tax=Alligator mississippiensis TaxID=8496 RepID=A0A151N242_ALLMI|nr:acylpyruvase FAHD1, mitochondrial [Alligator mississippiensis]KYO30830.1 acylpyruvase FAHD1, mitochondrial [Alligator mississippiensis]